MLVADPIDVPAPSPVAMQLLRLASSGATGLREGLVDLVVGAGRQPGSTWLALVLGGRDEVGYAVELCGTAPDAVAPRCPPGVRAGALLTLGGDDPAVVRLVEGLASGRHRLTLLLVAPGGDVEAARALLMVGEPERAGARARLGLLACAGQAEAVLALPAGTPPPPGLPGRGTLRVPLPPWLATPPAAPRLTLRRRRAPGGEEASGRAAETGHAGGGTEPGEAAGSILSGSRGQSGPGDLSRRAAIAGLPRPLAVVSAAALLASVLLTGVVVARHAADRAPGAAGSARAASPSASGVPSGSGNVVEPGSGFPLARGPYRVPAGIAPGAPAPAARIGAASAVDRASGHLVIFGGAGTFGGNGGVLLSDTWERGPSGWLLSQSPASPPAASGDALGWDPVGSRLLLVSPSAPETWAYSEGAWTQLHPAHLPPACPGSMAVDPGSGRLDLLLTCAGGHGAAPVELWSWTGADWQRAAPLSGAPAPAWPAMLLVDPGGRTLLMAATISAAPAGPLQLWRLGASAWVPAGHSPAEWSQLGDTDRPILLSDPADHLVVSAQTAGGSWAWDGASWSRPAQQVSDGGPDWIAGWGVDASGHLLVVGGVMSSSDTADEWTFGSGGWAAVPEVVIG